MLAWKPACKPLVHATDDVAAAYGQLRCAHPEYTVVAIWSFLIVREISFLARQQPKGR